MGRRILLSFLGIRRTQAMGLVQKFEIEQAIAEQGLPVTLKLGRERLHSIHIFMFCHSIENQSPCSCCALPWVCAQMFAT